MGDGRWELGGSRCHSELVSESKKIVKLKLKRPETSGQLDKTLIFEFDINWEKKN